MPAPIFDPKQHPRTPEGKSGGGRFTSDGTGGTPGGSVGTAEKRKTSTPAEREAAKATAATRKAANDLKKAAAAKEKGRIDGSRTIVREELSGDDPVSLAKRRAAEAAHAVVAKRAKMEGVSLSGMSEGAFFALAQRAGLDTTAPATVHATLLNSAGMGASTARTQADKAAAAPAKAAAAAAKKTAAATAAAAKKATAAAKKAPAKR